ncbi:hypothetical protein ACZ87_03431, partial [Candidatus Erwinia dacicola]
MRPFLFVLIRHGPEKCLKGVKFCGVRLAPGSVVGGMPQQGIRGQTRTVTGIRAGRG